MSAKITMPLDKARVIVKRIQALYPDAHCELIHDNVFQLLIAVMLSAQATDVSVNKVTPALFERFPTPEAFLQASPKEIEPYIQTIGLYRNKAKFIYQCCEQLIQRYGGEVPRTRKELMDLAGVGRKTANVVLAVGFGIPALAVDTHVDRVAKRLGFVPTNATPLEVEEALMEIIPKEDWAQAHHAILFFGRYYSTAKNPKPIDFLFEGLE